MTGGTGNDRFTVDSQDDVIIEKSGGGTSDTVAALVSYVLGGSANIEKLLFSSAQDTSALNLTGNGIGQAITGNAGKNVLNGLGGSDTLGLGGNDTLDGGTGADTMIGGKGDDTYIVQNLGDVVDETTGGGIDLVKSSVEFTLGTGQNNLTLTGTGKINGSGNEGGNIITGNSSRNILTGDGDRDAFVFNTALSSSNIDSVTDFDHKTDTFQLENAIFKGLSGGTVAANSLQLISSATDTKDVDGNDFILYDKDDGNLYFDQDGSGTKFERIRFAAVTDNTNLDNSDFFAI